jgi:hypothetical protein
MMHVCQAYLERIQLVHGAAGGISAGYNVNEVYLVKIHRVQGAASYLDKIHCWNRARWALLGIIAEPKSSLQCRHAALNTPRISQ